MAQTTVETRAAMMDVMKAVLKVAQWAEGMVAMMVARMAVMRAEMMVEKTVF